ncbi:MAG: S8 family serine peptidase [Bdellovibrionaceae bacterium]|nr:S8 family serine peptidase [Pseudobdellovibrionaceae bacterium]
MKSVILAALLLVAGRAQATEYLVKYKNTKGLNAIHEMAALKSAGMMVVDSHAPGSYVVVDIAPAAEGEAVTSLMSDSNIEWIHENGEVRAFEAPVDTVALKDQWALAKVQATKAWQRAGNKGNRKVIVAVIDTGVDYQHRALSVNMVPGFDFIRNNADPMDETGRMNPGHGTHCAGVIGATGLIEGGTVGLSPEVSIMPIRFLGPTGGGDFNNAVKSIDFAIENGAQVISASWGATIARNKVTALIEAVKRASDKGVIFVVAAANDGRNNDKTEVYPANATFENTIAVAASTQTDAKASFSNYGKANVHVAAPGVGILSTIPKDGYMEMSGTSMATPLVAGLVALLKAQDPNLTGAQIRALIQTTGAKAAIETACACRVDAFNAVDHLLSKKPWMVPAAGTFDAGSTVALANMNLRGKVQYSSSNPEIMTVDDAGVVTMVKMGTGRILATDEAGQQVSTLDFIVGKGAGSVEECPYSESVCRWTCRLFPSRPYCKK